MPKQNAMQYQWTFLKPGLRLARDCCLLNFLLSVVENDCGLHVVYMRMCACVQERDGERQMLMRGSLMQWDGQFKLDISTL